MEKYLHNAIEVRAAGFNEDELFLFSQLIRPMACPAVVYSPSPHAHTEFDESDATITVGGVTKPNPLFGNSSNRISIG